MRLPASIVKLTPPVDRIASIDSEIEKRSLDLNRIRLRGGNTLPADERRALSRCLVLYRAAAWPRMQLSF